MAAKTITSTEIKKLIKAKGIAMGLERTIKGLKLGKVDTVIISSNCPEKAVKDLDYYAGMGKAEIVKAGYTNEELGVVCKKPFSISVLSILKGG